MFTFNGKIFNHVTKVSNLNQPKHTILCAVEIEDTLELWWLDIWEIAEAIKNLQLLYRTAYDCVSINFKIFMELIK